MTAAKVKSLQSQKIPGNRVGGFKCPIGVCPDTQTNAHVHSGRILVAFAPGLHVDAPRATTL